MSDAPRLFVLMGVCGCGKSTIGAAVAEKTGDIYLDGDHFHPDANIEKMKTGSPLTDEDRWPWLERVAKEMAARPGRVFTGCSALKRVYRDHINRHAGEPVMYVHLEGSKDLILSRMSQRTGHFMPTSLVDSQFAALEPPGPDELSASIDIAADFDTVVSRIIDAVGPARTG